MENPMLVRALPKAAASGPVPSDPRGSLHVSTDGRARAVRPLAVGASLALLLLASSGHGAPASTPWTAADATHMAEQELRVARAGGAQALARLVVAGSLAQLATAGQVRRGLRALGSGSDELDSLGYWLGRTLEPEAEGAPPAGPGPVSDPDGLVRAWALLGPFEDTGGGLDRLEGPETAGHRHLDADYSWGAYRVRYLQPSPSLVGPRGIDLDLHLYPAKEVCSYLESVVSVPGTQDRGSMALYVASAGSVRVSWDGQVVARSDEQHPDLILDRLAARVPTAAGNHWLLVKMCSGALGNSGRVRVRLADDRGRAVPIVSSQSLDELGEVAARRPLAPSPTDPGAEPLVTPLGRALALGDGAGPQDALLAAIVRLKAGAEDLRSPRAPGLLDQAVASGQLRADELAVAGWIAPSASNRSGWLTRALAMARASGDSATASFALRVLVESRLQAGQADHAYATTREEPLAGERDAYARLLRARALAALGGSGLAQAAQRELAAIVADQGDRTPLIVWRAVAAWGELVPPKLLLAAVRQLRAEDPEGLGASYARAHAMLGAEELERATLRELPRQRGANAQAELARLLLDHGRYGAARETWRSLVDGSPNLFRAYEGMSRAELAAAHGPAAVEQSGFALARAQELEPQLPALAAEIAFRRGAEHGERAGASTADDLGYLVEPDVFLARARAKPAQPAAQFDRTVHWRRVVRLHPDKRVSQLLHWAREIVIEPRTDNERYEDIPSAGGAAELVLARVHRRAGSVVGPDEQETPEGGLPMVRWPKLVRGDVVEVAVRAWTAGPVNRRGDIPFYFVDYAGALDTRPVLYNEVIIDTPSDGGLAFDVLHGKPDRTEQTRSGDRVVTRLVWDAPPIVPEEPLAPAPTEVLPVVVGSSYPSWTAFLDWYRGAVEGFTEPDEQIRRLAAELTQPKGGRELTREQKVQALFEFVADDIRYVNFVSGEWWLPNRPQQLLARRQGDCDDKAMLLISLLRAVGIEAREVLVQTRLTAQPSVLESAQVAVPLFDHGIAYLPAAAGAPARFLDATSPSSRLGPLPAMDSGARILLVTDAGAPARIDATVPASAADHGVDARWSVQLDAAGDAKLVATERHSGDAAFFLRMQLKEPDARAQWVEQELLASFLPAVELDPTVSFDGELPGGAASVGYSARSSGLARREGDELFVAVAPRMPLTAELAPLVRRTLPVVLPPSLAPRHQRLELRIEAPPSHTFAELPPDAVEDGKGFGRAKVSFVREPGRGPGGGEVVTMRREIAFEASRIEVAQYPEWRLWLQRIDRLLQRGVRLQPRAAAPAR